MKKLLLVALIASSFMSLQSCGGDDNVTPSGGTNNGGSNTGGGNNGGGNTTTANLPTFIDVEGMGDTTIEYDSKNRFSKITVLENSSNVSISEFKYSNDVLTEIKKTYGTSSNPVTEYHSFTYLNNTVSIDISDKNKDDLEILIDNQGLALQTTYINSTNNRYTTTYLYDNNKNVISSISVNYKQDMIYDNAKGIFKNVNMPQWALFYSLTKSVNLISFPVSIYNNLTEISIATAPYIFQYTYNNDNYPITFNSNYYGQKGKINYSK